MQMFLRSSPVSWYYLLTSWWNNFFPSSKEGLKWIRNTLNTGAKQRGAVTGWRAQANATILCWLSCHLVVSQMRKAKSWEVRRLSRTPSCRSHTEPPPLNYPSCLSLPNMLKIEGDCQQRQSISLQYAWRSCIWKKILSLGFTYKENRAAVPGEWTHCHACMDYEE